MGVKKQGYTPKKRNAHNRKRASLIIIAAEGNNKTETLYLKKLNSSKVKVAFASGNSTDPINMVNELITECKEQDFDPELGDKAYCLIDSDIKPDKDSKIAQAEAKAIKKNVEVIVSNPCFEQWFMCHFGYSTKEYSSSEELVRTVSIKIPNYTKNRDDIYDLLQSNMNQAVDVAKRLEEYNLNDGRKLHTYSFQPSTEVYKIIEAVRNIENQ